MFNQGIFVPGSNMVGGFVGGSGTLNYVAKWTPNGTTIGNSIITDDGSKIVVNGGTTFAATPVATFKNAANTANFIINDDGNVYMNSPQFTGFALQVGASNVLQFITLSSVAAAVRIPNSFNYRRSGDDFIVGGCDTNNWFFQNAQAGQIVVSAKVHIQGAGATGATYGLKIQDSGSVEYLGIKNNGQIIVNTTSDAASGLTSYAFIINCTSGNAGIFLNSSGSPSIYPIISFGNTGTAYSQLIGNGTSFISNTTGNWEIRDKTANAICFQMDASRNFLLTNDPTALQSPSAKLHVISAGSTANTYNFKLQNSSIANLFMVKDNGSIAMPLVQTGVTGAVTGELYFDTAANILANSDLICARKS